MGTGERAEKARARVRSAYRSAVHKFMQDRVTHLDDTKFISPFEIPSVKEHDRVPNKASVTG